MMSRSWLSPLSAANIVLGALRKDAYGKTNGLPSRQITANLIFRIKIIPDQLSPLRPAY